MGLTCPQATHPFPGSSSIPRYWLRVDPISNPCFFTTFSSHASSSNLDEQGPAAIDYRSLLQPDEYQRLADSTLHDLQDKLEEYGDSLDIDGFDVDYENEVLTLKLGTLGTYVINKQTPNRQIWMSSPVSGPSRYDWDLQTNQGELARPSAKRVGRTVRAAN